MDEVRFEPTEVEKAPHVIRKAKFEIGKTDILVCGKCHMSFHYIEEFQEHRLEDKCTQESILRENEKVEPKEQVWAFTLWKNAILHSGKRTEPTTTWTLYKRWCALSEADKEAWIIAGQSLQTFTKLSNSRMHEIKGRTHFTSKKVSKSNTSFGSESLPSVLSELPQPNDTLEEGEVRLSQLSDAQRAAVKAQIAASNTNKENTTEIKKVPPKLAQLYADLIKKPKDLRRALRTGKNNIIEEGVFEKVLSRRFNHKNKCLEYFVKWENMNESENTWEPKVHFDKCRQIMDEFDKVFNTSKIIPKATDFPTESESDQQTSTRPPRSSKQKAKDQVKSWCDSMSDDEEASSKRKLFVEDSDSTDSFEKKIKMEEETDSSEDDKRAKKAKSVLSSVNGIPKKPSENITPQRVVRVSQKHLPNLSTGVYIMSKTEGIIKLNSDTPLPTSSPLLKVGQRIGQTQIKMVKKDTPRSPVKILPKPHQKSDTPKTVVKVVQPASKVSVTAVEQTIADKEKPPAIEEDSDDGLSELEFPTDLPLPEPDSPPGDFVLDPLTGKIAGQEYTEEETKDDSEPLESVQNQEAEQEATSLDTLVKMAVSDLPDVDDVVNDDKTSLAAKIESLAKEALAGETDTISPIILDAPVVIKSEALAVKTDIHAIPSTSKNLTSAEIDLESAITLTAIEKTATLSKPRIKPDSGTSILNAALTNTKPQPKKLLSTTPNTIRQKVIPRPPMRMPTPQATIIHKVHNKQKPLPQRTQFHEPIVRRSPNVNTYKPASSVARRIGSTTIYKTSSKPQTTQPVLKTQAVYKHQPVPSRMTSMAMSSPAPPISMPLIGIDDEPESVPSASTAIVDSTETDLLQALTSDLPTINLADTETPLFITGEDGTVYQVAGQNEEGQTILISEGPDGQQQCVIVSTETTSEEELAQPLLIAQTPEPQQQIQQEPQQQLNLEEVTKMDVEEPDADNDADDSQVVAQIVKADPPSPGGTRKVVLMLPDGNLMMTDVTAEQYAALELDK